MTADVAAIGDGPELKHGTKTSRAFNTVCHHYGVDNLNPQIVETTDENGQVKKRIVYPYNKVFAEYSDLVSDLSRKMYFIISVNPLDYLTMSNGVSWKSCHNIINGCYMGGTLSYMLDTTSMVTFVVNELSENIHESPKFYRQMFHYQDNMFMQNRLYPQGNDGAVDLYTKFRNFIIEEFSELIDSGESWDVETGTSACDIHVQSTGKHYRDYVYNNACNIFYPSKSKTHIAGLKMTVGHSGICSKCGKEFSSSGHLHHDRYSSECRIEVEV